MMTKRHPGKYTLSELVWKKYPLRTCRSLHYCEVCCGSITLGEKYFDGGYSRRAHERCIAKGETKCD